VVDITGAAGARGGEHKELPQTHTRMDLKTKEERVKEGITLLKRLHNVGIPKFNFGIQTIQARISEWASSGTAVKEVIAIPNYDRDAHLTLPVERDKTAELVLRQIPQ